MRPAIVVVASAVFAVVAWAQPQPSKAPDAVAPSAPTGLAAEAVLDTIVALSWRSAADDVGVARYEVWRDGRAVVTTSETYAEERQLGSREEYCYAVIAVDAAGNRSNPSSPLCVTTPDETPPTPPGEVSVRSSAPRDVLLEWKASSDAVGVVRYEVVREGEIVATSTGTSATVGGLRPGANVCHTIRAVDASDNRSPPGGPACLIVPDTVPPSTPSGVVAGTNAPDRMSLLWDSSTDDGRVASYELFRDGALVGKADRAFASDAGLAPQRAYCYTVQAVDGAGNRSPSSERACARTTERVARPEEEAALRVDVRSDRAVTLSWDPSSARGAIYRLYTDRAQRIGSTSGLTFTHTGLEPAMPYCYSVVVVHPDGREDPHGEACAGGTSGAAPGK